MSAEDVGRENLICHAHTVSTANFHAPFGSSGSVFDAHIEFLPLP